MTISNHFRERVAERIGADICPNTLWLEINRALKTGADDYVRFLCKAKGGRTFYRFRIDGRGDFAVVISRHGIPVTVFAPGMDIARAGKVKPRKLRAAA